MVTERELTRTVAPRSPGPLRTDDCITVITAGYDKTKSSQTAAVTRRTPANHVYYFDNGVQTRGPCVGIIYAGAAYYSIWGIAWLIRWKEILTSNEFATLMMLYPLVFISVIVQYFYPYLLVEMFVTSVATMLVSAFVLRPEQQLCTMLQDVDPTRAKDRVQQAQDEDRRRGDARTGRNA